VIQQAIEAARQAKTIGSSLEAAVTLTLPDKVPSTGIQVLTGVSAFNHPVWNDPVTLHEFFILSDLKIERGNEAVAEIRESLFKKCARCWKYLPEVGSFDDHPCLCGRCHSAVVG
jgi:isoleucyl-tRNA synthetase